jgi:hypothetical protein
MAKFNGSDSWTFERQQGGTVETFGVKVTWYTYTNESLVYVTIDTPEGETIEHRGTGKVERTLRVGRGERLEEPIFSVTVSSLGGDVTATERTSKAAAQAYASAVLREIVRRRDAERVAKALQPAETVEGLDQATVEKLVGTETREEKRDREIREFVERWDHEPGCPRRMGGDCLPLCKPDEEPEPERTPVGRSFLVAAVAGPQALDQAKALARHAGFDYGRVLHSELVESGLLGIYEIVFEDVAETRRHYALTGEEVLGDLGAKLERALASPSESEQRAAWGDR